MSIHRSLSTFIAITLILTFQPCTHRLATYLLSLRSITSPSVADEVHAQMVSLVEYWAGKLEPRTEWRTTEFGPATVVRA
jgi:hypothetical protein